MSHTLIAPSVLAADFANLQRDIEMINNSDADWFHIDIMDGVFVPNISFGMPVLRDIAKHATKTIDVHLMIVDPDRYISTFKNLGADILTVHYEACTHLHRTLQAIKAQGMKAGVALNPHTSISLLEDTIQDIDLVCLMSVNPGFGGQSFIENTYDKVIALKELITRKGANTIIEIDGGVTVHHACHARAQNMGIKARDMLKLIPNVKIDVVERCAGHGGTFGVMKETHDLAIKVGRPTARQIKNKNNKYMASDCPLAGKHLKQLEVDTNISNDEAVHPIELIAKSYRL